MACKLLTRAAVASSSNVELRCKVNRKRNHINYIYKYLYIHHRAIYIKCRRMIKETHHLAFVGLQPCNVVGNNLLHS